MLSAYFETVRHVSAAFGACGFVRLEGSVALIPSGGTSPSGHGWNTVSFGSPSGGYVSNGLPRRFTITEVCQTVVASVAVTAKSRTLCPWSVEWRDLSYVVVCGWQDVLLIVAVCCLRGFRAP